MRKYFVLFMFMLLFITGCGEKNLEDVVSDFTKSVENSKSYKQNCFYIYKVSFIELR